MASATSRRLALLLSAWALCFGSVQGTTQLVVPTNDTLKLSSACESALTAQVSCDASITDGSLLYTWGGITLSNLTTLCTSSCNSSLASYRANVNSACANDVFTDAVQNGTELVYGTGQGVDIYNVEGYSVRPVGIVDYYILNYNLLCMTDNANPPNFCYILTTQNGTTNSSSSAGSQYPCGPCNLNSIRLQMQDSRMHDAALASQYSSTLSSCHVTAPPLTTPTAVFLPDPNTIVANYSTSTSCAGSVVALPTGQSCESFAQANGVSTDQLLMSNDLTAGCVGFPGNLTALCVPSSCNTYVVKQNDTCQGVSQAHNLTLIQLLSYNPTIDPKCINWSYQIGRVICVSNPLGYSPPNSTISGAANAPTPASTAAPVPTDAMAQSNTDCGLWYEVQKGDGCAMVANKMGISLDDFYFLNPEIDANCTNLWAKQSYCVQAVGDITTYSGYSISGYIAGPTLTTGTVPLSAYPTASAASYPTAEPTGYPLANGSIAECYEVFDNSYGNLSCLDAAEWFGAAVTDWVMWNPSVLGGWPYSSDNCTLQNQTEYCGSFYNESLVPTDLPPVYIAPPDDATANATDECQEWYFTMQNDTCDGICEENNIPVELFIEWNPAVGSNCQSLWLSADYCIWGPGGDTLGYSDYPSATGSATVSTTGPPGPVQTGIASNCDKWYLAKTSDGCSGIASEFSIPLSSFYAWNPAVGTNCMTLWASEAYCVGVSSSTAKSTTGPSSVSASTTKTSSHPPSTTTSSSHPSSTATSSRASSTTTTSRAASSTKTTTTTRTSSTSPHVTPPAPTQSGIPANCNKYAIPATGQGCYDFAAANGISLTQLYQWNPVLNNDCENFWGQEAYCIGVSS